MKINEACENHMENKSKKKIKIIDENNHVKKIP